MKDEERTLFRALAARALYLSLDRPDTMFASKELCRDVQQPTKDSVRKLKELFDIVYIVRELFGTFPTNIPRLC